MSSISGDNNNNDASSARTISNEAADAESNNNVRVSVPAAEVDMQLDMQLYDAPPPAKPKYVPKPPKKMRKLTRKLRGANDRKTSTNNIKAAKAALGINPSANDQSVISAMCIPSIEAKKRSPNKAAVKQDNAQLRGQVTSLIESGYEKEDANTKLKAKLSDVEQDKKDLVHQLRMEKKASNSLIQSTMDNARRTMDDAVDLMSKAKELDDKIEAELIEQANEHRRGMREERQYRVSEIGKISSNLDSKLKSHDVNHRGTIYMLKQRHEKEKAVLKTKLKEALDKLSRDREKWGTRLDGMSGEVTNAKARGRLIAQRHLDKASEHETELWMHNEALEEDNVELKEQLKVAKADKRHAVKARGRAEGVAKQRLDKWRAERAKRVELKDELIRVMKVKETQAQILKQYEAEIDDLKGKYHETGPMRKTREEGRAGGKRWDVWVVQVICELLVNGTPPSAIPANIGTLYETFNGKEPEELPSVRFVRQCRVIVQNIGETITAVKLARADNWKQLTFDATSRRQISFTAVVISLMTDGELDPVVVSSCVFMEDESSNTQAEGVVSKINSLKHRLERLIEVAKAEYPDDDDLLKNIPSPEGINTAKLEGAGVNTDTCNAAQAARRILCENVGVDTHEQDCMNHLRCVWCKAVEKEVAAALKTMVMDTLEEIAPELRVSCVYSAFVRAFDKFFSLSANYPKGAGEQFAEHVKEHMPGQLLFHVEGAQGSRNDLSFMAAPAIYMNRTCCLTFALHMLRIPKKQDNILLNNLVCLLTSKEVVTVSRLFSIFYISIVMPFRWLAGNTADLADYGWGAVSMGRALDTLHSKLDEIVNNPSLILDEDFMMNIFEEYLNELAPFRKYWDFMFNKKQIKLIARKSSAKVASFAMLRDELFHPIDEDNKATDSRLTELAKVAAKTCYDEMENPKKATFRYLSKSQHEFSWQHSSDKRKKDMLGCECTSDIVESTLGAVTRQIQMYNRIDMKAAGGVSDTKRNNYFGREEKNKNGKKKAKPTGLFHQFDKTLRRCILLVAIRDAPQTRTENTEELERQRECKRKKEELMRQKGLEKATENAIDAHYYHNMWTSAACIKGDKRRVNRELNKLTSESAKVELLKENIRIRVVGFGYGKGNTPDYSTVWSKKTSKELADRLRFIIQDEKKYTPPDEPVVKVPKPKEVPVLGTRTAEYDKLNEKYEDEKELIRENAETLRLQREARGEGSMYSIMQPHARPDLDELIGKRIDVLENYDITNPDTNEVEPHAYWSQGEVLNVVSNKPPKVKVNWDIIPNLPGYDKEHVVGVCELKPSLWNKHKVGAWRMDIDIVAREDESEESEAEVEEVDDSSGESEMSEGDDDN